MFARLRGDKLPRRDSKQTDSGREIIGHSAESENGGTPGGTLEAGEDLSTIIDAWPLLSELERRTILAMVETSSAGRKLE